MGYYPKAGTKREAILQALHDHGEMTRDAIFAAIGDMDMRDFSSSVRFMHERKLITRKRREGYLVAVHGANAFTYALAANVPPPDKVVREKKPPKPRVRVSEAASAYYPARYASVWGFARGVRV